MAVTILFCVLLAIVAYVYFGYPLALVCLGRLTARSVRKEDEEPSVTLMIAAYDEEDIIREKIVNSLALDYPREKLMHIKQLETELFSLLGANGSIFAIRRHLYSPIHRQRGDDFELPTRVLLSGHGVVFEPEAVSVEAASTAVREESDRKVRIANWMIESALVLLAEALKARKCLLAFQLVSHKLLRWFVPFFLLALLLTSLTLASGLLRLALILQLGFYGLAATAHLADTRGVGLPTIALVRFYFCVANAACLVATLKLALGRRKTTWTLQRSLPDVKSAR
jgi:hypothetical protein